MKTNEFYYVFLAPHVALQGMKGQGKYVEFFLTEVSKWEQVQELSAVSERYLSVRSGDYRSKSGNSRILLGEFRLLSGPAR